MRVLMDFVTANALFRLYHESLYVHRDARFTYPDESMPPKKPGGGRSGETLAKPACRTHTHQGDGPRASTVNRCLTLTASRGLLALGLRWPDFGRTRILNAANSCASLDGVSALQPACEPLAGVPADLYGSEGRGTRQAPAGARTE
jgi:hypothetical protein